MNKIFLDYNTCKKLELLGLKENSIQYYNHYKDIIDWGVYDCKAYTYEQCLNWLRTKYFINIKIEYLCSSNEILALVGIIDFMINKYEKPDIHIQSNSLDYYEVLTETILECLNIIEEWKM